MAARRRTKVWAACSPFDFVVTYFHFNWYIRPPSQHAIWQDIQYMIPYVQQVAHATVPHKISVFPVHPAISVHDRQLGAAKPSTRSVSLKCISLLLLSTLSLCAIVLMYACWSSYQAAAAKPAMASIRLIPRPTCWANWEKIVSNAEAQEERLTWYHTSWPLKLVLTEDWRMILNGCSWPLLLTWVPED